MKHSTLRKIIVGLIYVSFLTPLLFFPSHFIFPYIVPKAVFFRSVSFLAGVLALLLAWSERGKVTGSSKYGTPIVWTVTLFFVSLVGSLFAGVDWSRSLWDSQERMLGVFTLFHYVVLFLVARRVFPNKEAWVRPLTVFVSVGALTLLVGYIQKLSPDFLMNRGADRVVSTLGNSIYLGGFALFIFFVAILLAVTGGTGWRRWYFITVAVLAVGGIFISQVRGSLLGLVAGCLAGAFSYVLISGSKEARRRLLIAAGCAILLFAAGFAARSSKIVRAIPVVGTIVNISPNEGTAHTRLLAWKIAVDAWQARPVLGWGPANFQYAFSQYYNPQFLAVSFQETWFDSAHNIFFNTLTTQGALGLLIYLSIYACVVWYLWRAGKRSPEASVLSACVIGFFAAHAVHNFFVFENITSYLFFFVMIAYADSLSWPRSLAGERPVSRIFFAVAVIVGLLGAAAGNLPVAMANWYEYNARGNMLTGKVEKSIELYEKTFVWHSPYQADIDWDVAADVIEIVDDVYEKDHALASRLYTLAKTGISKVVAEHPLDVRARLVYTDILRGGMVLFDEKNEDEVEKQFNEADKLSPGRQQTAYSRMTFLAGTGKVKEAISMAEKSVSDYPTVAEGYYLLARFYMVDRQFLKPIALFDQAIRSGVEFSDPAHLEFVAAAYEREGRFRDALYWYDQAYRVSRNSAFAKYRDQLAGKTRLLVPTSLESFFPKQ